MEERSYHPLPSSDEGDIASGISSLSLNSFPVLKYKRDEKPLHYTLKIQSFSLLKDAVSKSESGRYESEEFDVGGYKWKLALYPDGDKKRTGSDHISLYLVTAEKNILSSTSQVSVLFTFFVFDHVKDQYLTIEDRKVRRYHTIKTEWGFPKLLSISCFNDASNGFLVDDCCVFGVEVFVMKSDGRGEVFSMIKEPQNNIYFWKIHNFSKLDKNYYESDLFTVGDYQWKIRMHPKGSPGEMEPFLSLFLMLCGSKEKNLPQTSRVYVGYELMVKKKNGPISEATESYKWFPVGGGWGSWKVMSRKDIMEPSNGYIVKNVVIIKAKINVTSALKKVS